MKYCGFKVMCLGAGEMVQSRIAGITVSLSKVQEFNSHLVHEAECPRQSSVYVGILKKLILISGRY